MVILLIENQKGRPGPGLAGCKGGLDGSSELVYVAGLYSEEGARKDHPNSSIREKETVFSDPEPVE